MDDPLVALTFWQNQDKQDSNRPGSKKTKRDRAPKRKSNEGNGRSSGSNDRAVSLGSKSKDGSEERTDSNKLTETCPTAGAAGGGESAEGGSRSPSSEDHCFPCLPGLDDSDSEREGRRRRGRDGDKDETVDGDKEETVEAEGMEGVNPVPNTVMGSPVPEPQDFWLMRLFQSNLFDMSIAIGYLFNAKEPDVRAYLCQKLFVSMSVPPLNLVCLSRSGHMTAAHVSKYVHALYPHMNTTITHTHTHTHTRARAHTHTHTHTHTHPHTHTHTHTCTHLLGTHSCTVL